MELRSLFFQHVAQTAPAVAGLQVEQAEGIYITGADGKKYIDLISGIAVSNTGHRHPAVLQAIRNQLDKYLHTMVYGEHIQSPQVLYARKLVSLLPPALNQVYFTNSGAEAMEGTLKLAKRFTGRQEIISFHRSYHGSTQGALSIMGDESYRNAFRPLIPGNRLLTYNSGPDLECITEETAAVVAEVVQAEAGVIPADGNWLKRLRERCTESGTLLVLDECQTAFGRTGTCFGFEKYGVIPDVLVLAKALGGGMPLGAFIAPEHIMKSLTVHPPLGHITTFGGHPVSCAAGLAALAVMETENLAASVSAKEELFRGLLGQGKIRRFRSAGLLMALDFEDETISQKVIAGCLHRGLLTDWFLFAPHCMRLAPPLVITADEISACCSIILQAIDEAG